MKMESSQEVRVVKPIRVIVADKAPEVAKEGKMLQLKLGSRKSRSKRSRLTMKKSRSRSGDPKSVDQKVLSSTVEKMVTVDDEEATYGGSGMAYHTSEENVEQSCWRRVWGNYLCPFCGVTRWRKKPKLLYSDPKAKHICAHILCRLNSMYYYFAHQLGPEVKYFAEELFFKNGQIEADGLCAITAQIWAATYLLQFEVATMKEPDWSDIRKDFLNLVWTLEKFAIENQNFYDLHQEFHKHVNEHLDILENIVADKNNMSIYSAFSRFETEGTRLIDGLFLSESFMLKNKLVLLVSPPHEETLKFEEFNDNYRIKTIKYFLNYCPTVAITLGKTVINSNYNILQSGHLPLLTPNFPVNESKFTYCEGMVMLEEDLKELIDTVVVPTGIHSDLIDWVSTIREVTDQYCSYGQWIADKMNEMKEMCQLCYEYADKAYSMELPSICSITQLATHAMDITDSEEAAIKPKLQECKIPIEQRKNRAEKYHSTQDKLENYMWEDFFCTEYHEVLTRLPLTYGPTEYLFHECKHKKSS